MLRSLLVSFMVLFAFTANAQFQGAVYAEDSSIKAFNGAVQKQLAWCGGFNNPQFTTGDLNRDGKIDLVVYDYHSNQIKTFINTGTVGKPNFTYAPKYAANFPSGNNYLILADYNRDGIPDMFNKGAGGFAAYKGYYNNNNELSFTYFKDLRYSDGMGNTINANSNAGDIPSIVDIDGDGDLDFFGFNEGGAIIYFFKNCQVEHGLPNDSIVVCKPTNCWGRVNQGINRSFVLGIMDGDQVYCPSYLNYDCRGTRHGGNTICMIDVDGDSDYDLFDGNFSYDDLQLLHNGRIQNGGKDSIVSQDTTWKGLTMTNWPAAFNVDVDGDGKKDILISPHGVNISQNYQNIAYYKNTGTTTAPVYSFQTDTFLVDKGIDVGTGSYPFIYDYDRDGRPDLFIGTSGYFQTGGLFRSKIAYYRNVLENGVSKLMLQTMDFNNIFAESIDGAAPAFGDLNNDGKDDLIVGHTDGTLTFYQNTAASNYVAASYAAGVILKDTAGVNVRSANFAVPFIYDITKDGKPDLLIAGQLGKVALYKNMSTTSGSLRMGQVTDTLGGMRALPSTFYGYASIYVGKVDNTGKDYILLGNSEGTIRRYGGFESGSTSMSYQLLDDQYSTIDVGDRSTVAVGDLNGDGKYEMILGNVLGGLNQYTQVLDITTNVGIHGVATAGACSVYPNPASDHLYITWDNQFAAGQDVHIQLINITGQTVERKTINGNSLMGMLPVGDYPAGIYVCLVQAGNNVLTQRVVIRK